MKSIVEKATAEGRATLSFEYFPPKDDSANASLYETFDELNQLSPDFVSVTYGAGGSNRERSLAVLDHMAPVVPTIGHLTCVGASRESTSELIKRFEQSGAAAILALRGDPPKDNPNALAEGEIKTALELVELANQFSGLEIGVAAFPEVHPESPNMEHDLKVLDLKVAAGASFAVTQLFFSVDTYFKLVAKARAAGIVIPIVPGLLPISNAKQVLRMAAMSGASVPTELVAKLEDSDESLAREIGMEFTIDFGKRLLELGAPGLHIFTLNQSEAAREVAIGVGLA
jgi:methylenetetrahydrofolate reductase (NADPH)